MLDASYLYFPTCPHNCHFMICFSAYSPVIISFIWFTSLFLQLWQTFIDTGCNCDTSLMALLVTLWCWEKGHSMCHQCQLLGHCPEHQSEDDSLLSSPLNCPNVVSVYPALWPMCALFIFPIMILVKISLWRGENCKLEGGKLSFRLLIQFNV